MGHQDDDILLVVPSARQGLLPEEEEKLEEISRRDIHGFVKAFSKFEVTQGYLTNRLISTYLIPGQSVGETTDIESRLAACEIMKRAYYAGSKQFTDDVRKTLLQDLAEELQKVIETAMWNEFQ
jgi:hypothetical protein